MGSAELDKKVSDNSGRNQPCLDMLPHPDFPHSWDRDENHLVLNTVAGNYHVRIGIVTQSGKFSLVRACDRSPRGWHAPYYGFRQPALSLDAVARAKSLEFYTVFGPDYFEVSIEKGIFQISGQSFQAEVVTKFDTNKPLIAVARIEKPVILCESSTDPPDLRFPK